MSANPLRALAALGQSVWLDYIRRSALEDGTFARLIADDGLAGITSNPAIFEKAIARHHDYDAAIGAMAREGLDALAMYERLAIDDVRSACDLFRGVHAASGGRDGFVSLEVSPRLADATEETVAEGRRLWAAVGRPNLMIKVPATRAGLPAIRRLLAAGVNVNVTLLFGIERYRAVALEHLAALEERDAAGAGAASVASVASFFLSRIDTMVDGLLDAHPDRRAAGALRGEAAVACARLAYAEFEAVAASPRWRALAERGAQPQRLLWASTSTKDPAYGDVKYVDAIVAPLTVNTLTPETLAAYRDHGDPAVRIRDRLDAARALPARLAALGIDLDGVAQRLEREGVRKFVDPFEKLLAALARRGTAG